MKNYFNNTLAVTCWGTAVVTLSLTPWLNVDSLVIPKLMILFSLALFVMPTLTKRNLNLKNNSKTRFLFVLLILIFCQLILVIINSEAPIEQQIFGRTGRGLGFLTEMSLIIVMMVTCIRINVKSVQVIITCLLVTTLITSTYSFFQRFGLDFFEWESRTNGIIGTLGNPNFQSSLAAMAIGPSVAHLFSNKSRRVVSFFPIAMLFATIYICESTQGYLLAIISITSLLAIYIWYSSKFFFIGFSFLTICFSVFIGLGMINKGLLAAILYKPSVQSRGEMSRAAFNAAKDNPLFGVGLDSLGDYYWIYRDPQDIQGIKEFSDNAHNIFLNHASTGGFILAILNLCVVLLALVCFLIVQKQIGKFDKNIAALF